MANNNFQISDAKKVLNARYKSNPNYHLIADENSNFVDDDTIPNNSDQIDLYYIDL